MNHSDLIKMSILLITTNQSLIDELGKCLYQKYRQHEVLFASGSAEAISKVDGKPDIYLIDMNSPPENVSLILGELAKQQKQGHTILLCSHASKALANCGFRYTLIIPINNEALCVIIDTLAIEIFFKRFASLCR